MNMVIPDVGKTFLLDLAFNDVISSPPDYTLHLYQNDYTPVDGTVAGDFVESTFTGYAAIAMPRADFGASAIVAAVAYTTFGSPTLFTCTGGSSQSAFGWFLTRDDTDEVVAAQRFDDFRPMSPGSTENVTPFKIALKTFV